MEKKTQRRKQSNELPHAECIVRVERRRVKRSTGYSRRGQRQKAVQHQELVIGLIAIANCQFLVFSANDPNKSNFR
jgi:tRNA(Arg) A34 adenosine deaminase TadA